MIFDMEVPTCREGVFVPTSFAGPKEIAAVIQRAEELGFNAVWGTDFITPTESFGVPDADPPNWYEPLITLAYVAALTSRIKLGTGVVLLPYRDPVILAKQAATLDQFSNGRLWLGLGIGGFRDEFTAIQPRMRRARRGDIMDEYIESLHMLLSHDDQPVSFQGEHAEFHDVNMHPRPVQDPFPMYVPGQSPESLQRVAKWGLGFMVPAPKSGERVEALKPVLEEHNRDLSQIDVIAESTLRLASTHEAAVKQFSESRQAQFSVFRGAKLEDLVAGSWVGTVDEVVEMIGKVKDEGITHFNALHIAGDTIEEMQEQMQMFSEGVIAKLQ